jgi:hypothetical protein
MLAMEMVVELVLILGVVILETLGLGLEVEVVGVVATQPLVTPRYDIAMDNQRGCIEANILIYKSVVNQAINLATATTGVDLPVYLDLFLDNLPR